MQERKTMSVYVSDQERLKPFFAPGDSWADALNKALNELDKRRKK